MASLAIEVIEKYDIQIIDSYYILPYAISGFLAKSFTGRPQILRHAGSDIGKLFSSNAYQTLFKSIFQRVDKIVTIPHLKEMFLSLGVKESALVFDDRVSVDTKAFNPGVASFPLSDYIKDEILECPIITYIGKINYYWQTKGLYELIEAVKNIKADYRLLFVANGKGLNEFKKLVKENNLENKSIFIDFVPPWKVPSIIKLSTCVVLPEREFQVPNHMPILPREVMAVGKCLIISRELYNKKCYGNLIDGENVLVVDPKNSGQFSAMMKGIIQEPEKALRIGEMAYQHSIQFENFNEYVNFTIECYRSLLKD
jgi:glycosyltransferase involved in cell wall biosynthesis